MTPSGCEDIMIRILQFDATQSGCEDIMIRILQFDVTQSGCEDIMIRILQFDASYQLIFSPLLPLYLKLLIMIYLMYCVFQQCIEQANFQDV